MLAQRWNQKGKVIILSQTTDEPLTLCGACAGECYGANTIDNEKNLKRGLDCLLSNHGRVLEYPQIYMKLEGWSARVIREFERHIGGAPTYLQASTRYIDYKNFQFVTPPSINSNKEALKIYNSVMDTVSNGMKELEELKIPREDIGMMLPLSMETTVIHRTNLRNLIDMAKVRKCSRAYWEFRELFDQIEKALAIYSDEWNWLINEVDIFKCKCEISGYCDENKSCGRFPPQER